MSDCEACCTADGEGVRIRVRVSPRARHSEIVGTRQGALRVRVAASPADGQANRALREALGAALGVRARDVRLVAGQRAREKVVRVDGVDVRTVAAALARAVRR